MNLKVQKWNVYKKYVMTVTCSRNCSYFFHVTVKHRFPTVLHEQDSRKWICFWFSLLYLFCSSVCVLQRKKSGTLFPIVIPTHQFTKQTCLRPQHIYCGTL